MDLTLPGETRVAVAGDWHGNSSWVGIAVPHLARVAPDVRTILHLGDFGLLFPERHGKSFETTVDYWARQTGIVRVLVTGGNHENWDRIDRLFAKHGSDKPVQISEAVWVLPRGHRSLLGGRRFVSFSGAASLDYADRTAGVDWFATEAPTERDVERAVADGPAEVLLTHETIDGGTDAVERMLASNPLGWNRKSLAYAAFSRERVTRVYEALQPQVLAHGHMHVPSEKTFEDGRSVYSLGCDGQNQNLAILDLGTLAWEWAGDPRKRIRKGRP